MKLSKIVSALFAFLGMVLVAGGIFLSFANRNAGAPGRAVPQEAKDCATAFLTALNDHDLESARTYLYGNPDLGLSQTSEAPQTAKVWDAFRSSFAVSDIAPLRVSQSEIRLDFTLTTLELKALVNLPSLARNILDGKEDQDSLYDENGTLKPQEKTAIMEEALEKTLAEAGSVNRTCTISLVEAEGRWWVLPNENLLSALSGGME